MVGCTVGEEQLISQVGKSGPSLERGLLSARGERPEMFVAIKRHCERSDSVAIVGRWQFRSAHHLAR